MCTPSRFLKDIDAKYLDMPSDAGASDAFASARERYGRPAFASPFRQPRAVEDDFVSPVKQAAQRQGHLTKLKNTMESSFSAAPATDLSGWARRSITTVSAMARSSRWKVREVMRK